MDKICIQDLEVYGFHGVLSEEKKLGQKFLVSLELALDLRKAGMSDHLQDTVHYGVLCEEITRIMQEDPCDLIEAAGEKLCLHILKNYEVVEQVRLVLKKPWAPIHLPLAWAGIELNRKRHQAYIALGSNLGDRRQHLENALKQIDSHPCCRLRAVSAFLETAPEGYLDQDVFLNGAACVETLLAPGELMDLLLEIEKNLKRERKIRWGPRTIDLDILLYDNCVLQSEHVMLPHPRMGERLFVLEPLSEIAPHVVHPVLQKTIAVLKEDCIEKRKRAEQGE